jgi:hypothetical protein
MRRASFSTGIDCSTRAISHGEPKQEKLLARLLQALHHSRRLQADRVLEQFRHLIASHAPIDTTSEDGGGTDAGH